MFVKIIMNVMLYHSINLNCVILISKGRMPINTFLIRMII